MTGHDIVGTLAAASEHVVVLECEGFPCVFEFDRMRGESAYRTRRLSLAWQRGGEDALSAKDQFHLGEFALRHGRYLRAKRHFALAAKLDDGLRAPGDEALREHRAGRRSRGPSGFDDAEGAESAVDAGVPLPADAIATLKETVHERLGGDLELVETAHFLIWTDWASDHHAWVAELCERMYGRVVRQFDVPPDEPVFAGKCPVFCLRSRDRFREVAAVLDGFDADSAVGYTHSDGPDYVHVVVCRQGGSAAALDSFASTLVHESTHAVLHRLMPGGRLPPWLNEGLANLTAEWVLVDRCPNAEAAEAAARAVVASDYSIQPIFRTAGMLDAMYYPAAQSVTALLLHRDPRAFELMLDDLVAGKGAEASLQARFGLTYETLERAWREAVRSRIEADRHAASLQASPP